MKLQHLLATVIVTGLALLAGACSKTQADSGHHEEESQPVVLTTPSVMSVPTTQAYVCRMQSRRHIEIRALNEGYLEEIPVQEGQAVRAGERLYEIYPVLYRTKLEAEKAELRLAEINLQNTEQLAGRGFVSAPELARATAERDRAKANVDRATAEVGFTSIVAPFDGLVGRQLMQQGSLIKAEDILTTLSDNSVMWVYFNVPEADYLRFKSLRRASDAESQRRLELSGATIQRARSSRLARAKASAAGSLKLCSRRSCSCGVSGHRMESPPAGISKSVGILMAIRSAPTAMEAEESAVSAISLSAAQQPE